MYWPKPGLKRHPEKRWKRPDRIFFGFGACHILAGCWLEAEPLSGFWPERILPPDGTPGSHIYVTDGRLVFDCRGYSLRRNFLRHYWHGWQAQYPGWQADIRLVDFPLLSTVALNRHRMFGPDQYFGDAAARARRYLGRINHPKAAQKALG